ncbi:hypothetical protein [Ideonella dechloratans]|uniref:hypothetical protein n=1 Tax=Ideonella dechloratans TaxID=36863 RepID=UPI0035B1F186
MLGSLGGWLRGLFRSRAASSDPKEARPSRSDIQQHVHGKGGVQIGHVDTVHLIQAAAQSDVELHTLQVSVLRALDSAGHHRAGVEAFMKREFGTSRVMHLSQPQLYRTQRYCETILARLSARQQSAK